MDNSNPEKRELSEMWNGYCPESWLKGKTVRMRLNDWDFFESEETRLQIMVHSGVQAIILNFRGRGKFRSTIDYADEIEKGEILSPQTSKSYPFNNGEIFKDGEEVEQYINSLVKKVYFIRHNFTKEDLEVQKEVRNELLQYKYVAIHFNPEEPPDEEWEKDKIPFTNDPKFKDDPKFKKAAKIFKEVKNNGGYVLAQYYLDGKIYIGKINPQSKINYLPSLKERNGEKYNGFKRLKIENIKCFEIIEFPVLFAIRPIQQTIANMGDTGSEIVRQIYETGRIEKKFKYLPPQFQELIVQEWLRSKYANELQLKYQFILTGKDYPLFDIIGETNSGKILCAQVTFNSKDTNKAKFTKFKETKLENETIRVMFSNEQTSNEQNVYYKNIEEVFNDIKNDTDYSGFIKKIFG